MIVQSAPEGEAHFIIKQVDHADTSGQFARVFGNADFAILHPQALMEYVITHHDDGWREVDDASGLDAKTRLPNHLTQTPTLILAHTSGTTPARNESHHPFCGVISSMHSWGLYHGRYGLSDKIYIDMIAEEHRGKVDEMLQGELDRQARLKDVLKANPETTNWADDDFLFMNYKLLQFFDTLALYFQTVHPSYHVETQFKSVPASAEKDEMLTLKPLGDDVYSLSPYPFGVEEVAFYTVGRNIAPFAEGESPDLTQVMIETPVERQAFKIVAG
ncbi:MAG: DUF3891 family protein [Aggregatilineales bacterium]